MSSCCPAPPPPSTISQVQVLVASRNAESPARIRNTGLGIESYVSLASGEEVALAENVRACADDDPCGVLGQAENGAVTSSSESEGGGVGFAGQSCVDGNIGVYCPCLEATVTEEEVTVGD